MMRAARSGDEEAILAFLKPHIATSMFLAGNLLKHGLFERSHRHGTEFWVLETNGEICGVLGATNHGNLTAQCPDADASVWTEFAERLSGRMFLGMTGVPDQVGPAVAALNIPEQAVALDAFDPLMSVDLAGMMASNDEVRFACEDDIPLLIEWWRHYLVDADLTSADDPALKERALMQAKASVTEQRTRILTLYGRPVAMSSINARVIDTVQIGGVFTPLTFRGRGYAGRAIAAQLNAEHATGITKAILFAASQDATRAYRKIGFAQIGSYRLFLTKEPVRLGVTT